MPAKLNVCAVSINLRQIGWAVANEVDEHLLADLVTAIKVAEE
jgi:hypothetical protein